MTVARPCFLGIDCGTGSTKALLLEAETGAVLGVRSAQHPIDTRVDGTSEQDPADWIAAVTRSIRDVLASSAGATVRGIAVSGQQHGLVALDDADRPVHPAKLWNDTTTTEECAILTDAVGGRDAALRLTGNPFLVGYTAPKILWLRRHEAEAYGRAVRFCLPHDYVNRWLTGAFVTEPGDASGTAYFDIRSRRYANDVLRAIDPDREWSAALPEVADSCSVVGELRDPAASALGLPEGIPVVAGGGDNMCAAIGVGAVRPGPVVVSLGTSITAATRRDEPAVDPAGELSAFCDSAGGWLPLACMLNGTGVVDWLRGLIGSSAPGVDAALTSSPAGARGLTFLPYLSGERTPDLPTAAGRLDGLRLDHDAADLVRATVEGLTAGLAHGLDALRRVGVAPEALIAVGGGSRSDAWCQLVADVSGLPVSRPEGTEAAAEGAARQARWVLDGVAPEGFRAGGTWEPRSDPALDAAVARVASAREAAVREARA